MIQNHLLQVLALVAMERPLSLSADHIRKEKLRIFEDTKLDPDYAESTIFGQYEGYTSELHVPKDSRTETYAALKLEVQTPRLR